MLCCVWAPPAETENMKTSVLSFGSTCILWLVACTSGECAAGPRGAKPQPVFPSGGATHKPLYFGQKGSVVAFLSFSADGKTLAYGLWPYPENQRRFKGAVVVWGLTAQKEIQRIEAPPVQGALSPDARIVAVRLQNGPVSLWDVARGKKIRECEGSKRLPCPSQLAFLPGARTLAGAFWDEGLYLWDTATGKMIRQMGGPRGGVELFAVSADGRTILAIHKAVRSVKYDPQLHGRAMPKNGWITISEMSVCLWDVSTGKEIWSVPGGYVHIPKVRGTWGLLSSAGGGQEHGFRVRVSAHGQVFFTPGPGKPPLLVDVHDKEGTDLCDLTGKKVRHLLGPPRVPVETVIFSPDGRRVVLLTYDTGPPEGTAALVYDLSDLVVKDRAKVAKLSDKDLEALWADLASPNDRKAHGALFALGLLPEPDLLRFLKKHIPTISLPSPRHIAGLIDDLDSPEFAAREKAQAGLQSMGGEVSADLSEALKAKPSAEKSRS